MGAVVFFFVFFVAITNVGAAAITINGTIHIGTVAIHISTSVCLFTRQRADL
jgi:hypothetical protein